MSAEVPIEAIEEKTQVTNPTDWLRRAVAREIARQERMRDRGEA